MAALNTDTNLVNL